MSDLFWAVFNRGMTVSWLVLAAAALRLVLKKAPKSVHCLLWGLVGLRLVWPFSIESRLSLLPSTQILSQITPGSSVEVTTGIYVLNSVASDYLTHQSAAHPGIMSTAAQWGGRIWAAGMAAMLLWALYSWLRLRLQVAEAIPTGDGTYLSDRIGSPFVLGLLRPRIYLPADLPEADRPHVIAHEQSHIRRRDHWWKPLGFVLLSVYWFNPLLWLGYILLCRDIEAATDEAVIRDLGEEHKAAYSRTLLSCSVRGSAVAVCPLAFGENAVAQRVKRVLHYKKPGFWVLLVSLAVCAAAAAMFLTDPEKPLPQPVDATALTHGEDCVTVANPLSSAWPRAYTDPAVLGAIDTILDGLTGRETSGNMDTDSWLSVVLRLNGEERTLLIDQFGKGYLFIGEEDSPLMQFDRGSYDFDYLWSLYTGSAAAPRSHSPVYVGGAILSMHMALSYLPTDGSYFAYVQELGNTLTIRTTDEDRTFSGKLETETHYTRGEALSLLAMHLFSNGEVLIPESVISVSIRLYRQDDEQFAIWEILHSDGAVWLWLGEGGEKPHRLYELIDRDQFHPGTNVCFWTHSPATSVLPITFTGDFTEVTVWTDSGTLSATPPRPVSATAQPTDRVTVAQGTTVYWIPGSDLTDESSVHFTLSLSEGGSCTDAFSVQRLSRCESLFGNVTYGISQDWLGYLSSRFHLTSLTSDADGQGLVISLPDSSAVAGQDLTLIGVSVDVFAALPYATYEIPAK